MKKNNYVVIAFFKVTNPYSGASEVSYDFFKNIPSKKKKLFQFSDKNESTKQIESIKTVNSRFHKTINLYKMIKSLLKYCKNKNQLTIIFEGASWAGYTYIVFKFLKFRLKNCKFIYHSHNVEYLLRKKKEVYLISLLTKYFEKHICKNFNIITCVSKLDQAMFKKLYKCKAYLLQNGINIPKNINQIKSKKFKFKYVFFGGSIEYKPNFLTLKNLIYKIMPLVLKKNPNIKLVVSGNETLPFNNKFLINTGFLSKKNFFKYLKGASLFVNPINSTFGTQVKIINALIFGKTIISSKNAIEGININTKFKNIFTTNNHNMFAKLIVNKINSKKFNKKVSQYYLKIYSMKNILQFFFKKKF